MREGSCQKRGKKGTNEFNKQRAGKIEVQNNFLFDFDFT